jgi:hypothetical protein
MLRSLARKSEKADAVGVSIEEKATLRLFFRMSPL